MTIVDTARRIAKAHPEALLPCPLCASSVKGANLASHITKVHADATPPPAAIPRATIGTVPAWRGSDARALVTLLLLMVPALAGAIGTLVLDLPRAIHAPFAIAWAAAVGESTSTIRIGTSVTTPTFRYNPAVLAQAFATLGILNPDLVWLGVGSG